MYQLDVQPHDRDSLPTMYDLLSEDPEEPGLPDQFHIWQPQLLSGTFKPCTYTSDQVFTATDLNVYYDPQHTNWYKRPDWFAVVGVPRLYQERDMRLSYVIWQERVTPLLVVELLSPGTETEDLGETFREGRRKAVEQPPTKWEVYEQILGIPYYVVFDRYSNVMRAFRLERGRYVPVACEPSGLWLAEVGLGLGVWQGSYEEVERLWLRWYDAAGNWIPTPEERAQQATQRVEQEMNRSERLIAQLRSLGIEPDLDK